MLLFINNVLYKHNHSVDSFLLAFVADNNEVNRKMEKKANLSHLPCQNHTVALDVSKSLCCVSLHCIVLHCVLMHCVAFCCIAFYCILFYCVVLCCHFSNLN